jgi:hypothetical protein
VTARLRAHGATLLLAAALGASACTRSTPPEAQVRASLARAEQAATRKDVSELSGLLTERFRDQEGRDRQAIVRLLRVYFLRHEAVYLLTRVQSIQFPEPQRAQVVVLVAMAGTPIATDADVGRLAADLHRFELTLAREGDTWRAVRAEWRRAEPSELW